MSMPINFNPQKLGPIEVFEDDTHFLVCIHPENRDRAKKIAGRQWDGDRKAWVYPKNPLTYEALVEEFQKDADSFNIRRPKTRRPPGIQPPVGEIEGNDNEFDEELLENIRSIGDIGEIQEKMYGEFEQIREMLDSLRDVTANQSRVLEEVRGTQDETKKVLVQLESSTQQTSQVETIEVLPDNLDLAKQKEIELLEKVLVMIVCRTASNQKSFCEWVNKHQPLRSPAAFVTTTHEFLKEQLGKVVGDESRRTKFYALVEKANKERIIYSDPNKPEEEPILILKCLNFHRNYFGHPDGNQWEAWKRSILYLMHLPLIWSKVVIDEYLDD
jgi:hypothetical protein